jgi:hypothetical protein
MGRGASRRGFLGTLAAGVAVLNGGSRLALAQCNLGSCHSNADCTCTGVETCGNDGECCRTQIGIYCNDDPTETGSQCCSPAYVCASSGVFPPPAGGGCQCDTAHGFTQDPTTGTCCIANGTAGNSNHPDLCCSGCVCPDGNCCDASHCQQQCIEPGQACNACHACCAGSTCTKPNAPCTGPQDAGVCCLSTGQQGNTNHPDLCCSGCVCSDGKCCDASHCQPQQCSGGTVPCGAHCINPTTQCCADEEIGILCQAPGFKSKCCPQGHQCHQHEQSKTFDCRIASNTNGDNGTVKHLHKRKRGHKH